MATRYPIYIVSKSRWQSRLTSKTLEELKEPYHIVVEQSQYEQYAAVIDPSKILILPQQYLDSYDTCDELGDTKSKGPGAARNFCWDHAKARGVKRHWVMDDNIYGFYRLHDNMKIRVSSNAILRAAEDFVDRYLNIPIAGLNYDYFAKRKQKIPPYILNTRIYSCLLIENAALYFWRGRYNEDTDLSLRVLKDGFCTVQFNAFLQGKVTTQTMSGGCNDDFYKREGTLKKSQMQVALHPDVSRLVMKFGRWHHHVDYSDFKFNVLKRDPAVLIPSGVNNYGMTLKTIKTPEGENDATQFDCEFIRQEH